MQRAKEEEGDLCMQVEQLRCKDNCNTREGACETECLRAHNCWELLARLQRYEVVRTRRPELPYDGQCCAHPVYTRTRTRLRGITGGALKKLFTILIQVDQYCYASLIGQQKGLLIRAQHLFLS